MSKVGSNWSVDVVHLGLAVVKKESDEGEEEAGIGGGVSGVASEELANDGENPVN